MPRNMKNGISIGAVFLSALFLFLAGTVFYPKWKKSGSEATISWDVSGYYIYLPAFLIYEDAKKMEFYPAILDKYKPTPDFQQAFKHESGNYVFKYPVGQAIQMLPFFLGGHLFATLTDSYEPDGYSRPYQVGIFVGGFFYALLGLIFLRIILLNYFSDKITATTIFLIVVASNYSEYAGITNAMTHNNLFALYCLLIFFTHRFYNNFLIRDIVGIAVVIGMMSLTRPTEIIAVIIPILWGLQDLKFNSLKKRVELFSIHLQKLLLAIIIVVIIGSLQLLYWQYSTGDWLVYSYEDQGFSWLRPHVIDGLFSYKSGWLVYSPLFFFALAGFVLLYRKIPQLFWSFGIFLLLFTYVAFAWDIWWYGGSLGQRTMVQTYPVWAFPLACFHEWISRFRWRALIYSIIILLFVYFNGWLLYQAHGGGLLKISQMTKRYFWSVVGRYEVDKYKLAYLDNKDLYIDPLPNDVTYLITKNFEAADDSCFGPPIEGIGSLCIPGKPHYSEEFRIAFQNNTRHWIRASADMKIAEREWNVWNMPQFIIKFYRNNEEIRARSIRINRLLDPGVTQRISVDAKIPRQKFDEIGVFFWNPGSPHPILVDNLEVITF
jgi:hypothetical protein